MDMHDVKNKRPEPMIAGALRLAQHRDATPGQVIRNVFGAPFPGHRHRHLVDRVIRPAWVASENAEGITVIEPC